MELRFVPIGAMKGQTELKPKTELKPIIRFNRLEMSRDNINTLPLPPSSPLPSPLPPSHLPRWSQDGGQSEMN